MNKDYTLRVRMTQKENARVLAMAEALGCTTSELICAMINNSETIVRPTTVVAVNWEAAFEDARQ